MHLNRFQILTVVILTSIVPKVAPGSTPRASEMKEANQWVAKYFSPGSAVPPFSFVYDGKSSADLLRTWSVTLDQNRTQRTFTWKDSKTGLEVRCVAVEYSDSPVVEWTA